MVALQKTTSVPYIYIRNQKQLKGQLDRMVGVYLKRGTPFQYDLETTGLNPRGNKFVVMLFNQSGGTPTIFDVRDYPVAELRDILTPLFQRLECIGANLKFDYEMTAWQIGATIEKPFDVLLAEQTILGLGKSDAAKRNIHFNLASVGQKYGLEFHKEERNWFIDCDKEPEKWNNPLPVDQLLYCAQDVTIDQIYQQQKRLLQLKGLQPVMDLEMSALPAIGDMELAGNKVNVDMWRAIIKEKAIEADGLREEALQIFGPAIITYMAEKYEKDLEKYNDYIGRKNDYLSEITATWDAMGQAKGWGDFKIKKMAEWRSKNKAVINPKPFTQPPNLNSHQQMSAAFEKLNIGSVNPKTGMFEALDTTKDDELEDLEEEFPQLKPLRKMKKAEKFVTSFGETLLAFIDPVTGRIHPEYQQYGASTGRMSCKRPNWQQIPSRDETGQRLRQCVIAEKGWKMLTADYSSIEPRILGELSGDKVLLGQFADDLDIYSEMAKRILNLPPTKGKKVAKHLRAIFKVVVLAVSYGMSAYSLADQIDSTIEEAEGHIAGIYKMYPDVKKWSDNQRRLIKITGETSTVLGRKRFSEIPVKPAFPQNRDPEQMKQWKEDIKKYSRTIASIERQALNTPIQGTSADVTKLALAFLRQLLYTSERNLTQVSRVVACVHDEIVVEAMEEYADEVGELLAEAMDRAAKHFLKLVYVPRPKVSKEDFWAKD